MISDDKIQLRKIIRNRKKGYSDSEKLNQAKSIFSKLERWPEFIQANSILLYWSMPDEVFTHDFVRKWAEYKTVLLPVVDGDNMLLKKYCGDENMKSDKQFGIGEPTGEVYSDIDAIDLAIIPGIAFDKHNYRMGRGRGYYDRFLSDFKGLTIGVCFDFQMVESVPAEAHDLAMDRVVSG